jgi:hypothetical protein
MSSGGVIRRWRWCWASRSTPERHWSSWLSADWLRGDYQGVLAGGLPVTYGILPPALPDARESSGVVTAPPRPPDPQQTDYPDQSQ